MKEHLMRPFAAIRPAPDLAQEIIAPPYDVLNTEEARILGADKPWSFLHVSKPEIDLPPGTDVFSDEVYNKAKENFNRMIDKGILKRDNGDYYYIYRLKMGDHVQTGIVGAGSVKAYDNNIIRRHEYTRPDKETDRVRQIDAVNAQTGPVFTTHKIDVRLYDIVTRTTLGKADCHVIGEGNVEHTLWVVKDQNDIREITNGFDRLGVIYIADGHHRSAAASRVASIRNKKRSNSDDDQSHNSFLIVSFPENEVRILDYNRVVKDLNGLTRIEFLEKINESFDLLEHSGNAKPSVRNSFGMYFGGKWYVLKVKKPVPKTSSPVDQLDISILTERLLEPVLGIGDPRVDPRIDFVGGVRGMSELEKLVNSGDWSVAFAIYPTSMLELMTVANAKLVMPPKSTWFEPKLADGMVSLLLE